MKILYFTTSINKDDFAQFFKQWVFSLNPSNQNFHDKLIRSLALSEDVEVISLRPYSRKFCLLKSLPYEYKEYGNIKYHYLKIENNKFLRHVTAKKQMKKILLKRDLKDTLILTDTINPRVIQLASYTHRKYNLPIVGICTDSPSNITGTSRRYSLYLLTKSRNLNGYITLTDSLSMLFNQNKKPAFNMEGIVEDEDNIKTTNSNEKYFFFGGSLLPRYGVYELIEAYKRLNRSDIKLYIAGHHEDERRIKEEIEGYNIEFLGLISSDKVLEYERNALANINPRPYSEDLDRFSIPSKTLEYFYSKSLTISVRNTKLQKTFSDCAIWSYSHDPEALLTAMKKALVLSKEERNEMALKAYNKVKELYSLSSINSKLVSFLKTLINQD